MKVTDTHVLFWRHMLGNWHKVEGGIEYDGKNFQTSEHLFMYLKAIQFGDLETAQKIVEAPNPKIAKDLGRKVKNYSEEVWEEKRSEAMLVALRYRAMFDPEFKAEVLKPEYSGKTFAEASPIDRIWGIGWKETTDEADDETKWTGRNLLGLCFMQLRKMLEDGIV